MRVILFLAAALFVGIDSARGPFVPVHDPPQIGGFHDPNNPGQRNLAEATTPSSGAANLTAAASPHIPPGATNGTTDAGATNPIGGAAKTTSRSDAIVDTVGTNATDDDSPTHKDSTKEDHDSKGHSRAGTSGAASVAAGSFAAVTVVVVTYFL